MSVAFRRESDEEHREPKFERPIPAGPNLVTARGKALIEAQVQTLEAASDAAGTAEQIEEARRELRYWRARLATARVVPVPEQGEIAIGARVRIHLNGKIRNIDIVGSDEADPATDRIAFSAPLAQALIGAEEGERVAFGGKADAILVEAAGPIPA